MLKEISEENKRIILALERKYPVEKWVVNGVHIWPQIRIQIFLNSHKLEIKRPSESEQHDLGSRSFFDGLNSTLSILKAFYCIENLYRSLGKKKLIFFGSHIHRNRYKDVYFNRFFDSMVDFHQLQNDVYMVEFQKVYKNSYNQDAIINLHEYLNFYKTLVKTKKKIGFKPKIKSCFTEYDEFFEELKTLFPQLDVERYSKKSIQRWALKIATVVPFFEKFYKKTNPCKVIMASYYGFDDLAAAMVAANKRGIVTIDFQHGPQVDTNLAYSDWNKLPKENYSTMPIEYWTWDKVSKKNIEKWGSRNNQIKVRMVGQPFIPYFKNNLGFPRRQEYLIYSLQPFLREFTFEDIFPENLIELIKRLEYRWILRLHPRSNYTKAQVQNYLKSKEIDEKKYSCEDAPKKSLPETFSTGLAHITNWSGCLLEARFFGIPTILLHPFGNLVFKEYVDEETVFFADAVKKDFIEKFIEDLEQIKANKTKEILLPIHNPTQH